MKGFPKSNLLGLSFIGKRKVNNMLNMLTRGKRKWFLGKVHLIKEKSPNLRKIKNILEEIDLLKF
ncbi:hypothetical protein CR513_46951, partial [Mucuna pruriens]